MNNRSYYRRISWCDGTVTQQGIVIRSFTDDEAVEVKPGIYKIGDFLYKKYTTIKEQIKKS